MQLKRVVFLLLWSQKHIRTQLGGSTGMTDENDFAEDREQPYASPIPDPYAPPVAPPAVPLVAPPIAPPMAQPVPPSQPAPHDQYQPSRTAPMSDQPLPVCDYTGEDDAPCEEPAQEKRWSGAAVVTASALGAVAGGVLVAAGLVWALGLLPGVRGLSTQRPAAVVASQKVTIAPAEQAANVAEAVATKVVPSVVNITIQQRATDPFTGAVGYQDLGNGSGVIIRSDGHILTNNHVVEGADRVLVRVGVEDREARVVGVDTSTDLAVLKIDGTGYPAIDVGSSKGLRVGQFVMAVGSPFGLEKTVTSGIVSALQRSEQVQQGANDLTTYTNLIQTDAAINPGNSGGALVDEQGKIVGINTLIQSPSGGVGAAQSAGIGFAIPIDFAKSIADQLINNGTASHPYMGVSTQTIDESIAAQYGLPVQSGALIAFVQPSGPAEAAGLRRGDIITKIGETPITSVADVFAGVREFKIGDTATVEAVRNDQVRTFTVKLGSDAAAQ
jgi:putative serine protease PepD